MKAAIFNELGGPEVLRVVDVPKPEPKDGEVRIAAETPGRIVEVSATTNDKVQAGDVLVTLDGGAAITMNAAGYPNVGTTYNSAATCATLVGNLLGGTPPSAGACAGNAQLRAAFSGGACELQACPNDFATPIVVTATAAN